MRACAVESSDVWVAVQKLSEDGCDDVGEIGGMRTTKEVKLG